MDPDVRRIFTTEHFQARFLGAGTQHFGVAEIMFNERLHLCLAGTVLRLKVAQGRWEDLAGLTGFAASAAGGASFETAELERAGLLALGGETHGVRRRDPENRASDRPVEAAWQTQRRSRWNGTRRAVFAASW